MYVNEIRKWIGTRPLILVGATVIVKNNRNEILFQHRSDTRDWGLPGGAMEPGESLEDTARRELLEETGLEAKTFELLGVFSGPRYYFRYPNGDETHNVIVLYRAIGIRGTLRMSDGESMGLRYFDKNHLPPLEKRAQNLLEDLGDRLWEC